MLNWDYISISKAPGIIWAEEDGCIVVISTCVVGVAAFYDAVFLKLIFAEVGWFLVWGCLLVVARFFFAGSVPNTLVDLILELVIVLIGPCTI